jgi:hypothetical protein
MKLSQLKQIIKEEIQSALNEAKSTTDIKTIKANLQRSKDGIYILQGGVVNGRWDFESLAKATPLYYTTDFRDPKLNSFQGDGMVKVDIDGENIDISEY